ncbi:TPA: antiviral reverse transcriptase Drt2 [Aeromonas veronii]|uniref:antiviral reverse transcriptase Drt2 n=1 Tax=Aeromonas veronii TaxID=654 RepID=UPI003CF161E5
MMNSENQWFRSRGYLHFDSPVKLRKACQIVKSPLNVAQHAFFPLIKYNIQSLKISIDKDGNVQKKIKTRPISYASHIDSHIYSYYSGLLSDLYEKALSESQLEESVLAFRSLGKSNIDFANIAFEKIKAHGDCTAIAMDISGFFDNLDHEILKSMWCKLLQEQSLPNDHFNIYRSLTKSSVVNRDLLYTALKISRNNPKAAGLRLCNIKTFREKVRGLGLIETNSTGRGIPQGTSISALLSNIYMLDFDKKIKDIVTSISGEYYRYCDDMLFIIESDKTCELISLVTQSISELKIEINDKKTEIRTFHTCRGVQKCDKPLQYLGFIFDGERKLLRSAALARFSGRMKAGVRLAKKTHQKANLIEEENGVAKTPLFKKKIYERYSHLSKRNFITYGHKAANIMGSNAIKKQLKPLWGRLLKEMNEQ